MNISFPLLFLEKHRDENIPIVFQSLLTRMMRTSLIYNSGEKFSQLIKLIITKRFKTMNFVSVFLIHHYHYKYKFYTVKYYYNSISHQSNK